MSALNAAKPAARNTVASTNHTTGASDSSPSDKGNPVSASPCYVIDCDVTGTAAVTFVIPPDVLLRIKRRAQSQSLTEYVWLNIIRPALYGHVY